MDVAERDWLMRVHRITNPTRLDRTEIAALLQSGHQVVVQFSMVGYSREMLQELNVCAQTSGPHFGIRFHGHQDTGFDAAVLKFLPDAVSLSLDCLRSATNLGALGGLNHLRECRIDIHEMDDPDILAIPSLRNVECMVLGGFRRPDQDLQHLQCFTRLRRLHVTGQHRHLEVVVGLPHLRSLSLSSLAKAVDLSCVSRMTGLENLCVMFGSRTAIDDIAGSTIRNLRVVRVTGLESLGDLSRFPRLERLSVQDQVRIRSITLPQGSALTSLYIKNFRTLEMLHGLPALASLVSLGIDRTAIGYDALMAAGLPASLRTLGFYTGKTREDRRIRADLDRRGYAERDDMSWALPDF